MFFLKLKDHEQSVQQHLRALRWYVILNAILFVGCFGVSFYFSADIYHFLSIPLLNIVKLHAPEMLFIVTSLQEGFFAYVKLSATAAAMLVLPFFIWSILLFSLRALKEAHRLEIILLAGVAAPLLFYLGVLTSYGLIFHQVWHFLVLFNVHKGLNLYLKVSEFISFAISLMFWFGVIFEIPILLYILYRLSIIQYEQFRAGRRLFIVASFILAAIITPPDPFSQIIMASLLIVFYELALILMKAHSTKR